MANIVRRENERGVGMPAFQWDPVRLMEDMLSWDPFRTLGEWRERLPVPTFSPTFEVKETPDAFVFKADLPGVEEKDLEISLTGNRLTVSGRRDAEERHEGETYYMVERSYGAFARSFALPEGADADHIEASLHQGVLTIEVPKRPEVKPRRISIKGIAEKVKSLTSGEKARA